MDTRKLILALSSLVLVLLLIGGIVYYSITNWGEFSVFHGRATENKQRLNLLVVGADLDAEMIARSDTILFASIDLEDRGVGVISIPRDTMVEIPGRSRPERINASYAHGGIDLTQRTVENLLGVEIDYYFDVDFNSFQRIIDLLGGVTIEVDRHMYYEDRAGGLVIDIPPGKQVLDGENALHYVRYREPIQADIGRIGRQQKFIQALLNQVFKTRTLSNIPSLLKEVWDSVNTNLTHQDLVHFTELALNFSLDRIEMELLPGEIDEGESYWVVDQEGMDLMVKSLVESKDYLINREISLAIFNGNGTSGQAREVAERLEKKGFNVVLRSNALHFNYQETEIIFQDQEDLDRIKNYLSGKTRNWEEVKNQYYLTEEADLVIIIGHDYLSKKG